MNEGERLKNMYVISMDYEDIHFMLRKKHS